MLDVDCVKGHVQFRAELVLFLTMTDGDGLYFHISHR